MTVRRPFRTWHLDPAGLFLLVFGAASLALSIAEDWRRAPAFALMWLANVLARTAQKPVLTVLGLGIGTFAIITSRSELSAVATCAASGLVWGLSLRFAQAVARWSSRPPDDRPFGTSGIPAVLSPGPRSRFGSAVLDIPKDQI